MRWSDQMDFTVPDASPALGDILYTDYIYFFQASGLVLLVAMPLGATPPGARAQLPTRRKIIAGVLGAAALGMLIPSIFWSVKDGQPAPPPCADEPLAVQDCRYDNKALYGVGYALTAALTGGLLLTLFVPVQAATPQAAPQAEKVQ